MSSASSPILLYDEMAQQIHILSKCPSPDFYPLCPVLLFVSSLFWVFSSLPAVLVFKTAVMSHLSTAAPIFCQIS